MQQRIEQLEKELENERKDRALDQLTLEARVGQIELQLSVTSVHAPQRDLSCSVLAGVLEETDSSSARR
jgi:hypothetical protein